MNLDTDWEFRTDKNFLAREKSETVGHFDVIEAHCKWQ